ncbi:probable polygalacturonase At3g15720 [Phoenix dactylifera]|uniref:Probable polygalacturonase At3g15720 n=1 Tax=Phoenix dactylifera TaxID=42345 RepID=A0A8B9AFW6_PHODC|nr:probable polygalacturonase At3g15720 [Phoenix dactylifera]
MAVAALLALWLSALCLGVRPQLYNVVDYQATGNGNSDDTHALLKSWRAACADSGDPTFLIPSGKTFLLFDGITFKGPCNSSIHVQVSGNIIALDGLWTNGAASLITFRDINSLTVHGGGQIDGQGPVWWKCVAENSCTRPPHTLSFIGCDDLRVSGIKIKDSPAQQMTIDTCVGVHVEGVTITAPGDSPNTDGILIAHSQHVLITASIIGTGDDCIAIGPGSSDVNITHIMCGPGHGISIGSLGRDGEESTVEKILVAHCHIFQAMTGVRIKTWQGGSGFAREILFAHINFTSVKTPIVIDQYYNPDGQRSAESSSVAVSNVRFVDLHGSSVQEVAISLVCSKDIPCEGIVMKDVSLYWEGSDDPAKSSCHNAHVNSIGKVIPQIQCLN